MRPGGLCNLTCNRDRSLKNAKVRSTSFFAKVLLPFLKRLNGGISFWNLKANV